ncbi:hypothetical protein DV737_g3687, partial [Chaetothyriales sp. CBS 132003]
MASHDVHSPPQDLSSSQITIPSDSEPYSSISPPSSSPPQSSNNHHGRPVLLYQPPTMWSILRGAAINLLLPFVNGLMLGFGELLAHEYGLGIAVPVPLAPASKYAKTQWIGRDDCPFCAIITTYPPTSPSVAPGHASLEPSKLDPPAYVLLSTKHVIAFLDIYPLTRGHVLCCPRRHVEKVGGLTADEGREMGAILPLLSRALIRALTPDIAPEEADYNIVQNNGPGAAQVVPHTHFHFIPRYPFEYRVVDPHPILLGHGLDEATKILFGRGQRHYRDEEDSERLVDVIRRCVKVEWEREFGSAPDDGGHQMLRV